MVTTHKPFACRFGLPRWKFLDGLLIFYPMQALQTTWLRGFTYAEGVLPVGRRHQGKRCFRD
jgi:hypothetical protein